ncbi:MAG TPA: addiction module protein [Longimicrobium sp.]|nr:addiction module protein [Longimicrobium sp.]
MSQPLDRLEAELLALSSNERAHLAHRLIASLDAEPEDDAPEIESAWAAEIERRLAEYRAGEVTPIPAAQVFAEARMSC